VVDIIAGSLGGEWSREDRAMVWQGEWREILLRLVKPMVNMNQVGPALSEWTWGVPPERCVLVHDDVDLPPGAVRRRGRSSDGGHGGVRSILQVFQTQAFPRVKVGVGRPADGQSPAGGEHGRSHTGCANPHVARLRHCGC
jgi:PTH1 family peptidyl-tRNA hydrolase